MLVKREFCYNAVNNCAQKAQAHDISKRNPKLKLFHTKVFCSLCSSLHAKPAADIALPVNIAPSNPVVIVLGVYVFFVFELTI